MSLQSVELPLALGEDGAVVQQPARRGLVVHLSDVSTLAPTELDADSEGEGWHGDELASSGVSLHPSSGVSLSPSSGVVLRPCLQAVVYPCLRHPRWMRFSSSPRSARRAGV